MLRKVGPEGGAMNPEPPVSVLHNAVKYWTAGDSLTGYCNRESFASRCVWLTQNSRSCAELRYIMPDRAKRKTLEIKWFSAFCGGSPYFLVIRLEPLNSDAAWWVSTSYLGSCQPTHLSITLILQCSSPECNSDTPKLINTLQYPMRQCVKNA